MKEAKSLLELRKKIKSKKPKFRRQDSHKQKKLKKNWRKPKGLQSKMRLAKKGYCKSVTKGYGSPALVRKLDKSGLKILRISSIAELENINQKEEGVLLSSTIGLKKKITIVKKAKEKGILLLNIKEIDAWLDKAEKDIRKKKQEREKESKKKKEKKKSKTKKKEDLTKKLTEEEKKESEKKEKNKILTKKTN